MRVIIVGIGDIGYELARDLTRGGSHEVVLIDNNEARCEDLSEEFDALVLEGDGTHPELLQKALIEESDALVASTNSDALNTVIAMLAKRFGVPTIISFNPNVIVDRHVIFDPSEIFVTITQSNAKMRIGKYG